MKYTAIIKNKSYEVEIGANSTVLVNGEPHRVDFRSVDGTAIYSLLLDSSSWEALVERSGDEYRVVIEGAQYVVDVQDERTRKLTRVTKGQGGQAGDTPMKAPMPGLVREVRVTAGEMVQDRQGVVILEAMKMENELRVPCAGIVKEIRVKPGDKVDQGQVLLVIK